ncbi:MAG: hypothetical protein ACI837_003059 [Crocinitomicaceae bacterium]|jgi:hypothetical protein
MNAALKPEVVEKEVIGSLSFHVKNSVKQHPELTDQIRNATRLGNAYHTKVSIIFEDDNGPKRVDTTVWAYGSKYICLKGGVWLPIQRIVEIKS